MSRSNFLISCREKGFTEMEWRERLGTINGPGVLAGIRLGDWLRLLLANGFRVHPTCIPRALSISSYALLNSAAGCLEELRYGNRVRRAQIPPPLFVLGHWRSGTTLLHDLLAVDDRFA